MMTLNKEVPLTATITARNKILGTFLREEKMHRIKVRTYKLRPQLKHYP
jgi:hypothetical protein